MKQKSQNLKTDDSEDTILSIFQRRKESFLESLQKILLSTGNDRFIKQMFEDKNSAMFVPDRVCELIERYLEDDREKYILELYRRIRTIEACFGPKKEKEIENVGSKILKEIDVSKMRQQRNNEKIRNLREKLNKIALVKSSANDIEVIKHKIDETQEYIQKKKSEILLQQKSFQREILQIRKIMCASIYSTHCEIVNKSEDVTAGYKTSEKEFKKEMQNIQKKFQDEIDQHTKKEEEMNKQVEKMYSKIQKLMHENSQLQSEVEKMRGAISHYECISDESINANKDIHAYETEINDLKDKINSKNLTIQSLIDTNMSTSDMDTSIQAALVKMKGMLNKKNAQVQKLKTALKDISLEYDNLEHALSIAKTDQELSEAKLAKVAALEKENRDLTFKISGLESVKEKLESIIDENKVNIDQITDENTRLKELMKDSSTKSAKFADIIAKNDELKEKIKRQKAKYSSTKSENEDIISSNHMLQINNKKANDEIELLKDENKSLSETLNENNKELDKLRKSEKDMESNINELKTKLFQAEKQKSSDDEIINNINDQMKELGETYNNALDELNNQKIKNLKLSDELEDVKNTLRQKETIINDLIKTDQEEKTNNNMIAKKCDELQARLSKNNTETHGLEIQLKKKEQEASKKDSKINKLKGKLLLSTEENKKLKQNLEDKQKNIQSLSLKLRQMQRTLDIVKDQNQSLRERIAVAKTEASEATSKLHKIESDNNLSKKMDLKKNEDIKNEFEKIKKEYEETKSQNSKLMNQISSQQNTINKNDLQIQNLQKQLKQKDNDMQSNEDKHKKELEMMKSEYEYEKERNNKSAIASKEIFDLEKKRYEEEQSRLSDQYAKDCNNLKKKLDLSEKHAKDIEDLLQEKEKKLRDENEDIWNKSSRLKNENDRLIRDLNAKNKLIDSIVQASNAKDKESIREAIDQIIKKANKKEGLLNDICSIFCIKDNKDPLTEMKKIKQALSDLMKFYNKIKAIYPGLDNEKIISTMQNEKKVLSSIMELFPSVSLSECPNEIADRLELLKSITNILNIDDINSIPVSITQMMQNVKDLEENNNEILNIANVKSQQELKKKIKELKDLEKTVKDLIPGSKDPIKEIQEISDKYNQIVQLMENEGQKGNPVDKLQKYISLHNKLVEENTQIVEIISNEYGTELVSAVETLRKDLGSAADLFQRIFEILSGPDGAKIKLEFPIKESVKSNFIDLISKFKVRTEDTTNKINMILKEARNDGYIGSDIKDAVVFISKTREEAAKDKAADDFASKLYVVQQNLDVINQQSEIDKTKMRKKIEELMEIIESEKTKNCEKEKELLNEKGKGKSMMRKLQEVKETQKKVKEELIRIIVKKPHDSDFLISHLSHVEVETMRSANVQI